MSSPNRDLFHDINSSERASRRNTQFIFPSEPLSERSYSRKSAARYGTQIMSPSIFNPSIEQIRPSSFLPTLQPTSPPLIVQKTPRKSLSALRAIKLESEPILAPHLTQIIPRDPSMEKRNMSARLAKIVSKQDPSEALAIPNRLNKIPTRGDQYQPVRGNSIRLLKQIVTNRNQQNYYPYGFTPYTPSCFRLQNYFPYQSSPIKNQSQPSQLHSSDEENKPILRKLAMQYDQHQETESPRSGYKAQNEVLASPKKIKLKIRSDSVRGNSDDEEQKLVRPRKPRKKSILKKTLRWKTDENSPTRKEIREERRKNAKKHLKICGWTMVYYQLLHKKLKQRAIERKASVNADINEKMPVAFEALQSYIIRNTGDMIIQMLRDKESFIFVGEKGVSKNKCKRMLEVLTKQVNAILDRLINCTKELPEHVFEFLALITERNSILPYDFLTEYELKRLQFTHFGGLKNVVADQSKMLIAGIVVVRIFIHDVFMRAKELIKCSLNIAKIFNIGSFIYNMTMEIIKTYSPIYPKNQEFLTLDLRIKPKSNPLKALSKKYWFLFRAIDDPAEIERFKVKKDYTRDGEIIEGFYSKQQMDAVFKEKKMLEDTKALLQGWINTLYEYSHQYFLNHKKPKI